MDRYVLRSIVPFIEESLCCNIFCRDGAYPANSVVVRVGHTEYRVAIDDSSLGPAIEEIRVISSNLVLTRLSDNLGNDQNISKAFDTVRKTATWLKGF
jgi:hypothetical protein